MTRARQPINVAVVCGGPSRERDVSIRSARQVVEHLPADYAVTIVEIEPDGRRFRLTDRRDIRVLPSTSNGARRNAENGAHRHHTPKSSLVRINEGPVLPDQIAHRFSVAFLVTHGQFGEDGHLQAILDVVGIPYTGSGLLASALAMDKTRTKRYLNDYGIRSPRFLEIRRGLTTTAEDARRVAEHLGLPCVVKPNASGSSIGVSIIENVHDLANAIAVAFAEGPSVLIEEYIKGRELTCAVLGNSEDLELTALPVVEIVPKSRFFDFSAKYDKGGADEVCPAPLDADTTETVQDLAKTVHRAMGCDGLTRSDFILSDDGALYFLEINTLPGMTEASLAPKEALAAGMSFSEFLDTQIKLALRKKRR